MAQIRLRDYKEPLTSLNHNTIQFTRKPGRFVGFDTLVATSTLTFKITHIGTGTAFKNEVQDLVGPVGVLMTTQGLLIIETTELIDFIVDTNSGNPKERVDLLVCNHQYVNIDGGQAATYSIIKGPIGDPNPPSLTNPDYQTIVGSIILPPGATDLTAVVYKKQRCPDSGDGPDARLNEPNKFQTFNQFNFSPGVYQPSVIEVLSGSKNGWNFNDNGNSFIMSLSGAHIVDAIRVGKTLVQDGTVINIQCTAFTTFRNSQTISASDISRGYYNVIIPNQFANGLTDVGLDRVMTLQPKDNLSPWHITLIKTGNNWVVINVQGYSYSSLRPGMVVEADLTSAQVADNFEPNGAGKNLYLGFQLCNGLFGTIDRRCRFSVMASDAPSTGAVALASELLSYALGSSDKLPTRALQVGNLPAGPMNVTIHNGDKIRKSGTSNGVIVLGATTVNGAPPDDIFGQIDVIKPMTIQGGGTVPLNIVPPYVATLKMMKQF